MTAVDQLRFAAWEQACTRDHKDSSSDRENAQHFDRRAERQRRSVPVAHCTPAPSQVSRWAPLAPSCAAPSVQVQTGGELAI